MKKNTISVFPVLFLTLLLGLGVWVWRQEPWRAVHDADDVKEALSGERHKDAAEHDAEPPVRVQRVDGMPAIQLPMDVQRQTGIQLSKLPAQTRAAESMAHAKVIDIQPLVEAQTSRHAALAEREALRGRVSMATHNVERLRVLHGEDIAVSGRQLLEAEAQMGQDRAQLAGVEQRLQDLHAQIMQQWGGALAAMVLSDSVNPLENFTAHRELLLLVTLKPGETLPAGVSDIQVDAGGDRQHARQAQLVAPAIQTDNVAQGETYFFRTTSEGLRVGMRLDAWVPGAAGARQGVEVPGAAVIWYADQLWVYKQVADDLFVRTRLAEYEETGTGWFVTTGLKAGDPVVVRGVQMLFTEEFRRRPPSEDNGRD
jgi:hypothetical protein